MKDTITVPIELHDGSEVEIEVAYTYSPGSPGRMYMPNGDPGYPPEPPEIEFLAVSCDGEDYAPLVCDNTRLWDIVVDAIIKYEDEMVIERKADAAQARYEMMRDR